MLLGAYISFVFYNFTQSSSLTFFWINRDLAVSEVIVDSDSDSSGTFSILFNHPRLVRPRQSRQVQQAASTSTGNTAISLAASSSSSSAATSFASSGAASSSQSRAMQGFVYGRNVWNSVSSTWICFDWHSANSWGTRKWDTWITWSWPSHRLDHP